MPKNKPKKENPPRYVTDPNDRGLRAYNDSLYSYNQGNKIQKKLADVYEKRSNNDGYYRNLFNNAYLGNKIPYGESNLPRMSRKEMVDYYDYYTNPQSKGYDKDIAKVIKEYKKLPIRHSNTAQSAELPIVLRYTKPIQPVIYKKATQIETPIETLQPSNITQTTPLPKYTSQKKMYQGYRFTAQTGLRAGWYHPEEVAAAMESIKKK
jgi:hypothetical protein